MKLSDIFSGKIGSLFKPVEYVREEQPAVPSYTVPDRDISYTDADLEAIKPILYAEISNRPYDKKQLEAEVILNTIFNRAREYKAKGTPKSISEIVAMPNQYQAYGSKQYKNYANPTLYLDKKKKDEIESIVGNLHSQIQSGKYKDNTNNAYYYVHNPDGSIAYDNKRQLFAK